MEVDLQAVCRVFEDVLNGSMLREQADRWAYAVVQEEETGVVTYSPPVERERIWAGVMYLYGINTMKAPNEYLHSNDDIREAMMAILCGGGDELAGDDSSASLRAAVSQEPKIRQTYSIFRAYRSDVINRRVSHETPLGHADLAP
jgi:hypothetical protein